LAETNVVSPGMRFRKPVLGALRRPRFVIVAV
jgi:hypothetical protein